MYKLVHLHLRVQVYYIYIYYYIYNQIRWLIVTRPMLYSIFIHHQYNQYITIHNQYVSPLLIIYFTRVRFNLPIRTEVWRRLASWQTIVLQNQHLDLNPEFFLQSTILHL